MADGPKPPGDGDPLPHTVVDAEKPKAASVAESEFQLPLNLLRDHIEFMCDGVAGGNFNTEVIKIVFFADKPIMDTNRVRTMRVQIATMNIRRSQIRTLIKQLTEFADGADKAIAEKAASIAAAEQGQ
jgi:hypothetical protein